MDCPWPRTIREAIGRGIVLAPEDRKRQGLVLSRSVLSNLMLADIHAVAAGTRHRRRARGGQRDARPATWIRFRRLDTEALNLRAETSRSSSSENGCNRRPKILLLDEPTRGIDLGAKQEIFQTIRSLSDRAWG